MDIVHGLDISLLFHACSEELLGRVVRIEAITASNSVFDAIAKCRQDSGEVAVHRSVRFAAEPLLLEVLNESMDTQHVRSRGYLW